MEPVILGYGDRADIYRIGTIEDHDDGTTSAREWHFMGAAVLYVNDGVMEYLCGWSTDELRDIAAGKIVPGGAVKPHN